MSAFLDELLRRRTIRQDGFKAWFEDRWIHFKVGMDNWPGIRHWNSWWHGVDSEPLRPCEDPGIRLSRRIKYWVVPIMKGRRGFYPLFYTWYVGEHTFIFATTEEASKAADACEFGRNPRFSKEPLIQAWWYGLDDIPNDENFPFPERKTWYDLSKL